ncbi:hypothetical protein [Kitasatospora sp. KL5]|uniref:hypothetical protein n=1 Tax=Kitasatospora sp. KL5 TaxID=3425125 RepID=UPI003D6DE530
MRSIHCCEAAAERGLASGSLTRRVLRSASKNVTADARSAEARSSSHISLT